MKQVTARALVIKQKESSLYCFTMNALELEQLCFVEPLTRDNQKGLQRVTEVARMKEIASYIVEEDCLLPNNIILNLKPDVKIEHDSDGKMATITFPSEKGEYAFVVDGQHRIFSFTTDYYQLKKDTIFELPVVAFYNASVEVVGATFVSININQKPVNKDLLTQMKLILGLLDNDIDKSCIELIHCLDVEPTSPLHNRIYMYPKDKNKWIKTNQLLSIVKTHLLPGGCLHDKNPAERKRILIAYLQAFSKTFAEAWSGEKRDEYSLLQTSSLQIIFGLLQNVMQRCDFYEGFTYNLETFSRQIKPLSEAALLNNWKKSSVDDPLSTKPKREMFFGQLKAVLAVKPL
jgi:DGQHR domain-containing protein